MTWPEYLIILSVATLGASVQGAIGFGANLMAVPVVAVFAPEALPAAMLFWAMPMTVAMVVREHHGVSWWSVGWATVGRLPGNAAGAWVVSAVANTTLSVIIGTSVLLAVLVSVWAPSFDLTPTNITTAGFASGLTGTASSIGGPPLAVLYQHQKGPVLRSTMAAVFMIGTVTSTVVLLLVGEVHAWHVLFALALLPGQALGLLLSNAAVRKLDGRHLRPAVLTFAALTAATAIIRGLL